VEREERYVGLSAAHCGIVPGEEAAESAAEAKGKPPLLERVWHHSAMADCAGHRAVLRRASYRLRCKHESARTQRPELKDDPALASLALAGIVTGVSLVIATVLFSIAYVNRDAKRRGMNSALWTILVIILLPAWGFIGFVIYLLMREP